MIEERRSPRVHNRLRRRLKDFVTRWGDVITLVMGVILVCVSVAVVVIALQIRSSARADARDSAAARKTSRASCLRTRTFGPALADAYERYEILTATQLAKYRETIPRSCP